MKAHRFLLIILSLIVNIIIINYVQKLEEKKCECSEDWRRDFIKIFSIVTVLLIIFIIILNIIKVSIPTILLRLFRVLFGLYGLVAIVNIIALFTYAQKMMTSCDCDCSKEWERTFIYYYSILIAAFYILVVVAQVSLYARCRKNYLPFVLNIMKTQKKMCPN